MAGTSVAQECTVVGGGGDGGGGLLSDQSLKEDVSCVGCPSHAIPINSSCLHALSETPVKLTTTQYRTYS